MKKSLLTAGFFVAALGASAQVYSHDFEGGTPLAGWTMHGTSGATIYASDAGINGLGIGGSTTTFWAVDNAIDGTAISSNKAMTTSWFTSLIQADSYLISPSIALTSGSGYKVTWDAESFGSASYLDPYEVKISGTGTAKGDFTQTIFTNSTGAPNSGGESMEAIIPAGFVGGNIHIAFVATGTDKYILAFDNVTVETINDDDIEMTALTMPQVLIGGAVDITGTVTNVGANPINSFTLSWDDGSGVNTETVTTTIAPGATYNFTHGTQLTAVAGTTYNLDVCATVANDGDLTNDCITNSYSTASQAATRLPLIELFTSSTCPPCYTLNYSGFGGSGLNSYLTSANANAQSGANVACVKYQVNWPGSGDHAYNSDCGTRVNYYGVTAAPTILLDAQAGATSAASVTAAASVPAYVDITATHSTSGGVLTVNVTANPYASYTNAKLFIALLDKNYAAGTDASFSNNETEFHHVFRKMLPNGSGTTINLASGTAYSGSETYTYNFNSGYPAQGSFDLHAQSEQEVVVFIQDANGDILNAAISTGEIAGTEENESELGLSIYPNPSVDMTNVRFTILESANVTVEVVNALGQVVSSNFLGEVSGTQNIELNTSDLEAGMYLVNVNVSGNISTQKITVRK